ncbi:MAG: IS66 family insertion sequence element accessory protein TnpB [Saprospiraceae bacterium]|jgi:transposase|nr:IS66 family insertion sequence element accessory protein TnpB [Saprospiraceae bacterium]MBK9256418.1 IS66 family insertion sequence element accessory protein TnpB [Saprospiraceae bacterium]MBK9256598.1 IS66 family insertion sequence element accessory protein TnpB [Saprospiraceae bacterium]MBK9256604.1 IS66 family insertion sequence element accessory protein TnpB [Saprospiraceae bacterium]MBK9256613.1 IS66 family insertion sequence element accessory protein TnpB [Saprospiraceae bacterium]
MLGFGAHQRYYLYKGAVDMRKGYDGLSGLVRNELEADPMNGDVYVFFNRSRRTVKLLTWDRDGFVLYCKRLEGGCYEQLSGIIEGKTHLINYQHLIMLLSGISLIGLHQRPRYEMQKTG